MSGRHDSGILSVNVCSLTLIKEIGHVPTLMGTCNCWDAPRTEKFRDSPQELPNSDESINNIETHTTSN